ncbi:MAG: VWA domain-containing protein, partial [Clostridiales bacterium]|nr:VWA domain-containing protein [Clostridiales bacterium]
MSVSFDNPWLLFVLIPAVGLALIPYFRVPKQHRNTRNRVISLVLHCVILLLAVFALAGLSFTFTQVSLKKDVILLVDASDSATTSKEEMDEFIGSVLDEVDSDHRVGIVTFGGDCIYSAEMSSDPKDVKEQYSEQKQTPVGDATDISSALKYARSILSSPEDGRIIILSDGRQTDNNAVATVKALSEEGVRIDTVYFPSSGKSVEAQISNVEVQAAGGSADIIVTVDSTVAQRTELRLYDGDTLVEERSEALSGGTDIFSFGYSVIDSRMHVVRVEIEPERDTLTKNNTHYAYVNVNASSKVLLVDGSGNGATDLMNLIGDSFEVTKVTLSQLPTTLEELCEYGEVILLNVANSELPKGFDDMLVEYVEAYGGGLYTVGGSKAYQQEDMEGTKFQELLPVNANTDAKSLGLLLVIDSSGSMEKQASGSKAMRIELAIEAAVASVNALAPDDYVGVISFNSEVTVVSEMASLDRKDDIIRRIKGIKTATGTHYFKTLEEANRLFNGFNKTELKHIIFLTDGEPAGEDGIGENEIYTQVDRIARNGITLSTIALGPSFKTDIVKNMAEHGGGRFIEVVKESELIKRMVEETTIAAGQYLNQGEFTPSITSHTPAVSGITELP